MIVTVARDGLLTWDSHDPHLSKCELNLPIMLRLMNGESLIICYLRGDHHLLFVGCLNHHHFMHFCGNPEGIGHMA
jgi:hypothetical protein